MQGVSSPWHPTLPGGCDHLAAVQCKHACIYKAELIPFLCKLETEGICSPHQLPFWQGGSDPTSSHIRYIISIFACDLLTDPASVPRTTYYVSRILASYLAPRTSYQVPRTPHHAPGTSHLISYSYLIHCLPVLFGFVAVLDTPPPHTQSFGLNTHTKCFAPRTSCLVPRTSYFAQRTTYLAPHTSYHVPHTTYTCWACQKGHKHRICENFEACVYLQSRAHSIFV